FFQAEDGIRDFHVTGVQTCALPIWRGPAAAVRAGERGGRGAGLASAGGGRGGRGAVGRGRGRHRRPACPLGNGGPAAARAGVRRSEERRVGKEGRLGGSADHQTKKR